MLVYVQHPGPGHAPRIDAQLATVVDVIVDDRREQVVGCGDGVEIAGEVQIDSVRWNQLSASAAGASALDAKTGAEGGFAKGHARVLAELAKAIRQADAGGGLAFARFGGGDGRNQDEFAASMLSLGPRRRPHLVHAGAKGQQVVFGKVEKGGGFLTH